VLKGQLIMRPSRGVRGDGCLSYGRNYWNIAGIALEGIVLVPASVLATVVVIINGIGDKLRVIVLTLVGTLVSLQMGYVVGSVLRFFAHACLPAWMRDHCSGTKC
jgi:hypothetical protein